MNYKCGLTSKHGSTLFLQPLHNNGGKQNENEKKKKKPKEDYLTLFDLLPPFFLHSFYSLGSLWQPPLCSLSFLPSVDSKLFLFSLNKMASLLSFLFQIAKPFLLFLSGFYSQNNEP